MKYLNYFKKNITILKFDTTNFKYSKNNSNSKNNSKQIEERFWKLWKINIFKKYDKYENDDYDFKCVKTIFHKKPN